MAVDRGQRRGGRLPLAAQVQPPVSVTVRAASPGSSAEERHALSVSPVQQIPVLPVSVPLPAAWSVSWEIYRHLCRQVVIILHSPWLTLVVVLVLGLWLILLQAQRLGVTLVIVVLMWVVLVVHCKTGGTLDVFIS